MPTFGLADAFFRRFPCLADRNTRSVLCTKVVWIVVHVVSVGGLFLFDTDLIWTTKDHAWCTVLYFLLLLATGFQYFFTSCSSPGYVVDAMKIPTETHANAICTRNWKRESFLEKWFVVMVEASDGSLSSWTIQQDSDMHRLSYHPASTFKALP